MSASGRVVPRPAPGAPRQYSFPRFERRQLPNGVQVVVAPVHKLPLVTVIAVIEGGASCDPRGREGLAALVAAMLPEGTRRHDGESLALRFEGLGASVRTSADWDVASVSSTVMSARLGEVLPLIAEMVMAPGFPARELERLKGERLAELMQLRTEPRGLADEMTARFTYAPESRYSKPEEGSAASIAAITERDVGELYAARYRPAGTTLILAGDVDVEQATALAEQAFGDWTGSMPAPTGVVDAPTPAPRAVHIIEKSDAPQSEIRLAHAGVPRTHPDYFRIVVMNALLGGLFSSRINLNLRERNAFTYGARSDFEWRRGAGPFVVSTAVASDVTAAAAREALAEIERMRQEPVSADELSLATSYLAGVFPIRYETTTAIANALAVMTIYGLDADYFDRYRDQIRAVTAQEVLEAAQRHIHPERLRLVVVGDPALIATPLAALDIGPVQLHDSDGLLADR
jgi:zinc protease